ncbi:xanthine dehydrogenase family protein molybdopterin-binding subunit [Flindersiella endophytica]
MTSRLEPHAVGQALVRADGVPKVTGTAAYAYEQPVESPAYVHPLQATIARGRITAFDTALAEALDGVLAVLTHLNAPRLASDDDRELAVLQSDEVAFRGQLIGAVVAESAEIARQAADLVGVAYETADADVELHADRDDLYTPEKVNPSFPSDTSDGDVESALSTAPVTVDHTYTTPMEHNNPMEPHATIACWDGENLTLFDSTQGVHTVRKTLAGVFGLELEQLRVVSPYVGGGFGSKGMPHAHNVLAVLAAQVCPGRPVKLALARQQLFALVGYRTPTIQRVRIGADGTGRITAIAHDVIEQTSRFKEFAEQTAVVTRMMYAAPNRATSHRLAALDVPVPSWMRAPGECPGMYALESAMDELAVACAVDPIELRVRNEPAIDAETGLPFSSRNLVACLREGARRFGWSGRSPVPGARQEDDWLVGTGVAGTTYPARRMRGSVARIQYRPDQKYSVDIGAADIGTGTWTALAQIAADALGVPVDRIELRIGDTDLPAASVEGGSTGIASWGSTIVAAAEAFREQHGAVPSPGAQAQAGTPSNPAAKEYSMHGFGAQFAEVRVHAATGEIRVPRLLGVFAVGRIVNPRTARSQLIGGMTMGLSMALHEASVVDPRFGHVVNHDLAEYHIATCADTGSIEATWIDEDDPHVNPMGAKGIGEIGIVGTAAAIANATYHATGVRIRDLPITADKVLEG